MPLFVSRTDFSPSYRSVQLPAMLSGDDEEVADSNRSSSRSNHRTQPGSSSNNNIGGTSSNHTTTHHDSRQPAPTNNHQNNSNSNATNTNIISQHKHSQLGSHDSSTSTTGCSNSSSGSSSQRPNSSGGQSSDNSSQYRANCADDEHEQDVDDGLGLREDMKETLQPVAASLAAAAAPPAQDAPEHITPAGISAVAANNDTNNNQSGVDLSCTTMLGVNANGSAFYNAKPDCFAAAPSECSTSCTPHLRVGSVTASPMPQFIVPQQHPMMSSHSMIGMDDSIGVFNGGNDGGTNVRGVGGVGAGGATSSSSPTLMRGNQFLLPQHSQNLEGFEVDLGGSLADSLTSSLDSALAAAAVLAAQNALHNNLSLSLSVSSPTAKSKSAGAGNGNGLARVQNLPNDSVSGINIKRGEQQQQHQQSNNDGANATTGGGAGVNSELVSTWANLSNWSQAARKRSQTETTDNSVATVDSITNYRYNSSSVVRRDNKTTIAISIPPVVKTLTPINNENTTGSTGSNLNNTLSTLSNTATPPTVTNVTPPPRNTVKKNQQEVSPARLGGLTTSIGNPSSTHNHPTAGGVGAGMGSVGSSGVSSSRQHLRNNNNNHTRSSSSASAALTSENLRDFNSTFSRKSSAVSTQQNNHNGTPQRHNNKRSHTSPNTSTNKKKGQTTANQIKLDISSDPAVKDDATITEDVDGFFKSIRNLESLQSNFVSVCSPIPVPVKATKKEKRKGKKGRPEGTENQEGDQFDSHDSSRNSSSNTNYNHQSSCGSKEELSDDFHTDRPQQQEEQAANKKSAVPSHIIRTVEVRETVAPSYWGDNDVFAAVASSRRRTNPNPHTNNVSPSSSSPARGKKERAAEYGGADEGATTPTTHEMQQHQYENIIQNNIDNNNSNNNNDVSGARPCAESRREPQLVPPLPLGGMIRPDPSLAHGVPTSTPAIISRQHSDGVGYAQQGEQEGVQVEEEVASASSPGRSDIVLSAEQAATEREAGPKQQSLHTQQHQEPQEQHDRVHYSRYDNDGDGIQTTIAVTTTTTPTTAAPSASTNTTTISTRSPYYQVISGPKTATSNGVDVERRPSGHAAKTPIRSSRASTTSTAPSAYVRRSRTSTLMTPTTTTRKTMNTTTTPRTPVGRRGGSPRNNNTPRAATIKRQASSHQQHPQYPTTTDAAAASPTTTTNTTVTNGGGTGTTPSGKRLATRFTSYGPPGVFVRLAAASTSSSSGGGSRVQHTPQKRSSTSNAGRSSNNKPTEGIYKNIDNDDVIAALNPTTGKTTVPTEHGTWETARFSATTATTTPRNKRRNSSTPTTATGGRTTTPRTVRRSSIAPSAPPASTKVRATTPTTRTCPPNNPTPPTAQRRQSLAASMAAAAATDAAVVPPLSETSSTAPTTPKRTSTTQQETTRQSSAAAVAAVKITSPAVVTEARRQHSITPPKAMMRKGGDQKQQHPTGSTGGGGHRRLPSFNSNNNQQLALSNCGTPVCCSSPSPASLSQQRKRSLQSRSSPGFFNNRFTQHLNETFRLQDEAAMGLSMRRRDEELMSQQQQQEENGIERGTRGAVASFDNGAVFDGVLSNCSYATVPNHIMNKSNEMRGTTAGKMTSFTSGHLTPHSNGSPNRNPRGLHRTLSMSCGGASGEEEEEDVSAYGGNRSSHGRSGSCGGWASGSGDDSGGSCNGMMNGNNNIINSNHNIPPLGVTFSGGSVGVGGVGVGISGLRAPSCRSGAQTPTYSLVGHGGAMSLFLEQQKQQQHHHQKQNSGHYHGGTTDTAATGASTNPAHHYDSGDYAAQRKRLCRFYTKYCPDKLRNVDQILSKYFNQQQQQQQRDGMYHLSGCGTEIPDNSPASPRDRYTEAGNKISSNSNGSRNNNRKTGGGKKVTAPAPVLQGLGSVSTYTHRTIINDQYIVSHGAMNVEDLFAVLVKKYGPEPPVPKYG